MSKYTTITHRPNIDDVNLLLEEAITLESYAQLREKAAQVLEQPSRSRRLGVAGDIKRFFLDDGKKKLNPSESALVKIWNAISDEKTRRELLYTEFVRHVNIADAFVQEVLFPKLSNPRKPSEAPGVGDFTDELFPTDNATIRREDVDDFLSRFAY